VSKGLSEAQRRILERAATHGRVDAYMQRRRPIEKLRDMGLLEKTGLVSHKITDAGRAALASRLKED
jgi:hypothetical protein